jgi:ADP-heptose:LPS heptosyltransferase
MGDVLLAGPAVRAVAAEAARVTFLAGPRGAPAAHLLPGVDAVLVCHLPWIDAEPRSVSRPELLGLADEIARRSVDDALILTSFHQSPLPTALILRLAGVKRLGAISEDYPGGLLDVRLSSPGDVHEVTRALFVVSELGFSLPAGDDGRLRVRRGGRLPPQLIGADDYIVVHPGAAVPARAWSPERHAELVGLLRADGWTVVVTGGQGEHALTAQVAGIPRRGVYDLGGHCDLAGLAETLAGARAVVTGNTGPAHLSAAVSTPVVSVFAPTVPVGHWRPWKVPHELLYAPVECAGCRARDCPVPGHPCVEQVSPVSVADAVTRVAASGNMLSGRGQLARGPLDRRRQAPALAQHPGQSPRCLEERVTTPLSEAGRSK